MHNDNLPNTFKQYPWERENLSLRIEKLLKNKNKEIIVYIYQKPDVSCFRYRAYNMCETLESSKHCKAIYFFLNELNTLIKYLNYIKHIVIVRMRWSQILEHFICKAYSKNIKLFYDIDDLIYDIKKIPFVMNTINIPLTEENCDFMFSHASRLFLAASMCDNYITTNEFMENKLQETFNKKTYIVENFLNKQQMEISNSLWEKKYQNNEIKKNIIMGYFSGSETHQYDFESITSDLYNVMKNNKNIKLRLVGYLKLPNILQEFLKEGRIEQLPILHYNELQQKIAECDINLIPLLINEFTHSKSEIKYFEASIVGTVSIASPTYIYKKIIKHNENGYLSLPGNWEALIEKIIEEKPNTEIINSARKLAEEHYDGSKFINKIENIFLNNY